MCRGVHVLSVTFIFRLVRFRWFSGANCKLVVAAKIFVLFYKSLFARTLCWPILFFWNLGLLYPSKLKKILPQPVCQLKTCLASLFWWPPKDLSISLSNKIVLKPRYQIFLSTIQKSKLHRTKNLKFINYLSSINFSHSYVSLSMNFTGLYSLVTSLSC